MHKLIKCLQVFCAIHFMLIFTILVIIFFITDTGYSPLDVYQHGSCKLLNISYIDNNMRNHANFIQKNTYDIIFDNKPVIQYTQYIPEKNQDDETFPGNIYDTFDCWQYYNLFCCSKYNNLFFDSSITKKPMYTLSLIILIYIVLIIILIFYSIQFFFNYQHNNNNNNDFLYNVDNTKMNPIIDEETSTSTTSVIDESNKNTNNIERIIALFYHDPEAGDPLIILPPQKVNENTYQQIIQEFDFLNHLETNINQGTADSQYYNPDEYDDILNEYRHIHRGDRIYGFTPFTDAQSIDEFLFDKEEFVGVVDKNNLLDYFNNHPDLFEKMSDIDSFFTTPHSLNQWTFGLSDIPPTIKSLLYKDNENKDNKNKDNENKDNENKDNENKDNENKDNENKERNECQICLRSLGNKKRVINKLECCNMEIHERCFVRSMARSDKCPNPYCKTNNIKKI